eukprot:323697-Chlamydomonas_euryale.AAC.5
MRPSPYSLSYGAACRCMSMLGLIDCSAAAYLVRERLRRHTFSTHVENAGSVEDVAAVVPAAYVLAARSGAHVARGAGRRATYPGHQERICAAHHCCVCVEHIPR